MDSLSTGRAAEVLERLYLEAEAADRPLMEAHQDADVMPEQMIKELVDQETKDYVALYRIYAGNFLNVTPEFGRFCYICARACKAKRIVEFGSSFGISAIYLACALRDNGGDNLIGTELYPEKAERARENPVDAGVADLVEIRVGDALETLKDGVGGDVDLLMLDGALTLYLPVLKVLEPHLKTGAIVIGENAMEGVPGYLDYIRDPRNGYLSLPIPFEENRGNELTVVTR